MEWQWYQAASDHKFGSANESPSRSSTPFARSRGVLSHLSVAVPEPCTLRRDGFVRIAARPPEEGTEFVSSPEPERASTQNLKQRSWKKLIWFCLLEFVSLVLLVATLKAGTSEQFASARLTLPFQFAILLTSGAAVIVPIAFYGRLRVNYRVERYRRG